MEGLYQIMDELLDIQYYQQAMGYITDRLETMYDEESQREQKMLSAALSFYLCSLQKEMGDTIRQLDQYLIDQSRTMRSGNETGTS